MHEGGEGGGEGEVWETHHLFGEIGFQIPVREEDRDLLLIRMLEADLYMEEWIFSPVVSV